MYKWCYFLMIKNFNAVILVVFPLFFALLFSKLDISPSGRHRFWFYFMEILAWHKWGAECIYCSWIIVLTSTQTLILPLTMEVSHGLKPQIIGVWAGFRNHIRNSHLSFKHAHYFRHGRPKWGRCIRAEESHFDNNLCCFFVQVRA